ncbi:hypothetical protein BaRGS_00013645 [Batillaria attramentaria]|uniref:Rapamycin-insensitive companion of mTOR n=1 Tax=Batillaria attramentaria TaxID=370345 RepID=A0ABD0L6P9_9CAEN
MAAVAVRHSRNLRARVRARYESGDEVVRLDFDRDPADNVKEILRHIVVQHGASKAKKLAYLNSFVKLIYKQADRGLGVGSIEILTCLQVGLLHEAKEVRAATLRVLRHLLQAEEMLSCFLALHIDYLVMRSLDLCLENEIERMHAIRLIRQINSVAPDKLPRSLLFPIVAIGNDGASERDRFVRVCLQTLCEIAFRNVDLVSKCGGISTLLWNILDCHQFLRLNESLTCTIMYIMNHPRSRHYIKQLLAPLTDSHFRFSGDSSDHSRGNDRETRFIASKMAVTTLMHSWPGLIRLCHPEGSGLQSLMGVLYLPYTELRRYILEMISDLFRLPLPEWTDDFPAALVSVDPSEMQDAWKLPEGFVAEEGRCLLPHCAATRPNLVENHLALLLSAWISAGLLEALIEVITSSTEGALFNRAVILLGEVLHMANVLLPAECYSHSHCLASLVTLAADHTAPAIKRHRACVAITHLTNLHALKKRGPVPCSLFLDQLLHSAGKVSEATSRHWHLRRDKLSEYYFKKLLGMPNDDSTTHILRETMVLHTKENRNWDWDLIAAVLRWPDDKLHKLEDQTFIRFLRRLVFFFKPTNHLFSHMDLSSERARTICVAGCHLVDFLAPQLQEEAGKLISDLLTDIAQCLSEVATNHAVPESVFGNHSVYTTLSQKYFVFIGRFSVTKAGSVHLEKCGVFQSLMEMMTPSTQDIHVKLAISSLNYSKDGSARIVLSKALTATSETCRVYATKLLRVLLRANTPGFSSWGMELLVTQLYDQSHSVAMAALSILDEACDMEANLLQLIRLRPSLLHLGEKGAMLLCRFLSVPVGFRSLRDANFLPKELEKWHKSFNARYVSIVEEVCYEALTTYEKSNQGAFTRRSMLKGPKKEAFLPVHLYGQLAQHEEGIEILKKEACLQEYFSTIHNQELLEDDDITKLKAAVWAVGHVGSSAYGVNILEEENMVPELIRLAEECGVFSVRGTAFYALGLIASTRRGAEVLAEYGWESNCCTRRETWPVLDEQGWISESMGEAIRQADASNLRSVRGDIGRLSSTGSTQLSFIKEESFRSEPNGDATNTELGREEGKVCGVIGVRLRTGAADTARKEEGGVSSSVPVGAKETFTGVPRSRTLPNESVDYRRYQSLPTRSSSERHVNRRGLPVGQLPRPLRLNIGSQDSGAQHSDIAAPESVVIRVEGAGGDGDSSDAFLSDTIELVASPVIRLRADSEEEPVSPELCDSKGKEPISSESSQRSKGRTDSFNTDSTTSGVSSCESGTLPGMVAALSSLSPIPSSSSISTLSPTAAVGQGTSTSSKSKGGSDAHEPVHPSTAQRMRFRLSRVPSLHRRSASPALGSLQSLPGSTSNLFTTYRDVMGYATLRSIRRLRTYSADADPDEKGQEGVTVPETRITRTISIESDSSVDSNLWLSIRRNMSSTSLTEHDHQGTPNQPAPPRAFKPWSPHNRFVGLALPVDINMIFEVIEGEDVRSTVSKEKSPEEALAERLAEVKVSVPLHIPPLTKETTFQHSRDMCLLCTWSRQRCYKTGDSSQAVDNIPPIDGEKDTVGRKDSDADSLITGERDSRSRGGSVVEHASSATPGSQTSSASSDTATKKLTEDSDEGRRLIRMEVLRLIVNLSSSVGLKGSEQGLLALKQRFPSTFKDVCFFSEACLILSTYSFRLNARRFIQELFDEIDITKLVEGPRSFLGIKDDEGPRMAPIRQDSLDSFRDFS